MPAASAPKQLPDARLAPTREALAILLCGIQVVASERWELRLENINAKLKVKMPSDDIPELPA